MMWNIYKPELEEDVDLLEEIEKERDLILHNDDYNTFDWVIESLIEICGHTSDQAEQCAYIVHYKGKCQVKQGPDTVIRKMHKVLVNRGLTASVV